MTPWTTACQAPLSMGFSRQEYWRGLLFFAPGDLLDPGTRSLALQADSLPTEPAEQLHTVYCQNQDTLGVREGTLLITAQKTTQTVKHVNWP